MTPDELKGWAHHFNTLLPEARQARGSLDADDPRRRASDEVNKLLLEFLEAGGNVTHLAELTPDMSLAGWRRRTRAARQGTVGVSREGVEIYSDPDRIRSDANALRALESAPPEVYKKALQRAYANGVSLSALAKELGTTYYNLWSKVRS